MSLGISVQSFNGDLLYEPWGVYDESGLAFTTFDAYWGKCRSMPNELTMLLPPWKLVPPTGKITHVIMIFSVKNQLHYDDYNTFT